MTSDLRVFGLDELDQLPEPEPLVGGLLDRASFSVLYGPANSGKSFLALDIGLHVALGRDWHGYKITHPAPVLYILAEGESGFKRRVRAFAEYYKMDLPKPFAFTYDKLDLRCGGDAERVISAVRARFGENPIGMIIIDPLNRVFSGGDENSSVDMGQFISNCERLRRSLSYNVFVIHHVGKNIALGARGHSSLRAAIDTELKLTGKKDQLFLQVTKQRDAATNGNFAFQLRPVDLGPNYENDPITSCVVVPSKARDLSLNALSGKSRELFDLIGKNGSLTREQLRQQWIIANPNTKPDTSRKSFDRSLDALEKASLISVMNEMICLLDSRTSTGHQ